VALGLLISGQCIKNLPDRDIEGLSMWFGSLGVQLEKGGARVSPPLKEAVNMVASLLIALLEGRFAKKPDPPGAVLDFASIQELDDAELMVFAGLLRGEVSRLDNVGNANAASFMREVLVPLEKEQKRRA
jgi:hypothetical protein